jgi:hypothetical protein
VKLECFSLLTVAADPFLSSTLVAVSPAARCNAKSRRILLGTTAFSASPFFEHVSVSEMLFPSAPTTGASLALQHDP